MSLALDAKWKEKKAQKVQEYVKKKNARLGNPCCSSLKAHYLGMATETILLLQGLMP